MSRYRIVRLNSITDQIYNVATVLHSTIGDFESFLILLLNAFVKIYIPHQKRNATLIRWFVCDTLFPLQTHRYPNSPVFALGKIENTCRLVRNRTDYYLHIPIQQTRKAFVRKENNNYKTCGIDPGCRTFLTCYDPSGKQIDISSRYLVLEKYKKRIDYLKQKRRYSSKKRRIWRQEKKMENVVKDIHYRSIAYLLKEYDVIFYGDINSPCPN